eukprot:c20442_g1_i1 orf=228-1967(+)
MEQESPDSLHQIPIDISYSKLTDWLVDRRKMPADWWKKLGQIRNRIAAAFPALPKDVNPWFETLSPDSTGYLEAKRIRDILTEAKPEDRTFFGRLSGVAGVWDSIVHAYEKDTLYLGHAAQIMVQNVNYEVPYQKKQIAKLQQQLADLERKEVEYKRNVTVASLKYQQACQELGIQGDNVRLELLLTTKSVPAIFTEVVDLLCSSSVGQAVDYYQALVSYAHTKEGAESDRVTPILREIRDNPPVFHTPTSLEDYSNAVGTVVPLLTTSNPNSFQGVETELSSIDWNIDTEGNLEYGIDWDIENVDLPDPSQNITGQPSYYLDGHVQSAQPNISGTDSVSATVVEGGNSCNTAGVEQCEDIHSEIKWDISIEHGLESGPESFLGSFKPNSDNSNLGQGTEWNAAELSRFTETEYRNMLLDDLFEVNMFLTQRIQELERDKNLPLQNQVQLIEPLALHQYNTDSLKAMAADVSKAISLLTNKKTHNLLMILTSKRFLDRLVSSLNQKKQQEVKLLESIKDLGQKRIELRNMLTITWAKQDAALAKIRELKDLSEKTISAVYEGRDVNIIGEINNVLGMSC